MNIDNIIFLIHAMRNCYQGTRTVLDHCNLVWEKWYHLNRFIKGELTVTEMEERGFKLPKWFIEYPKELGNLMPDDYIMGSYALYHDCGKPFCSTFDTVDGKFHFPNHTEVSFNTWRIFFEEHPNMVQIANLIRNDMKIHQIKFDEVEYFAILPDAQALLVMGLAEIHANADMFGGQDSTSFKIKWNQIERRGKALCNIWFDGKK